MSSGFWYPASSHDQPSASNSIPVDQLRSFLTAIMPGKTTLSGRITLSETGEDISASSSSSSPPAATKRVATSELENPAKRSANEAHVVSAFGAASPELVQQLDGCRPDKTEFSTPRPASTRVCILDITKQPWALVPCIPLFGQVWRPAFNDVVDNTVTFYTDTAALFSRPTAAVLDYEQRKRQLPAALESNKQALAKAVEECAGELGDIGALYLENHKLKQELAALHSAPAPGCDKVVVRDSLQLPLGTVQLHDRTYFIGLVPTVAAPVIATQHRAVVSEMSVWSALDLDESAILEAGVDVNLARLFGKRKPRLRLLYRASKDGWKSADFHSKCDNKGPTLVLMRRKKESSEVQAVVGGYTTGKWEDCGNRHYVHDAAAFLFSLQTSQLVKLVPTNPEHAIQHMETSSTIAFGSGCDLSASMIELRFADVHLGSYAVAPEFAGKVYDNATLFGAGGTPSPGDANGTRFELDEVEVFACTV